VDAPEPGRRSIEESQRVAGDGAVYYHTRLTGASNNAAKAKIAYSPRKLLWKDA
jgi:hypothetical protein